MDFVINNYFYKKDIINYLVDNALLPVHMRHISPSALDIYISKNIIMIDDAMTGNRILEQSL
jgi:hypothetical protein